MNYILFDDPSRTELLPFTFTRPVCAIRMGILTIEEKWAHYLQAPLSYLTAPWLQGKYPLKRDRDSVFINGKVCPSKELANMIMKMEVGNVLTKGNDIIAFKLGEAAFDEARLRENATDLTIDVTMVNHVWDIFSKNGEAIKQDFELLTKGRRSQKLSDTNTVIGDASLVFLEEGAVVEASTLNTKGGPIYIGKEAEVMENSVVRGPFALGEHSALKLSTKVYGPTTIGPHSKVGGEINNSVIFGFSNKAHDGFLGNSVIGEWCNLGADTNNSNLKNNYANVKLFNYTSQKAEDTGLQFCGLMMGDHSKCGINTMFNTGTVVGVAANIYGGDFPPTHVPSFSWGGAQGFEIYKPEKFFETAERVYARRGMELSDVEKAILTEVFRQTAAQRQKK
ncbi:MAG: GlmU family protein [Bacteroidetes bacterium]|nr:GlmU family protein [Bacteroidota bacterium]